MNNNKNKQTNKRDDSRTSHNALQKSSETTSDFLFSQDESDTHNRAGAKTKNNNKQPMTKPGEAFDKKIDDINGQPWMKLIQTYNFQEMHEAVTAQPIHGQHPFAQKWNSLKSSNKKYPMNQHMRWHHVQLSLEVNDLLQYRDFILACPTITEYVKLVPNNKMRNTLAFGIMKNINKTPPTSKPDSQIESLDERTILSSVAEHTKASTTGHENNICETKEYECTEDPEQYGNYYSILYQYFRNILTITNTMNTQTCVKTGLLKA
jgi:hypothetical protein